MPRITLGKVTDRIPFLTLLHQPEAVLAVLKLQLAVQQAAQAVARVIQALADLAHLGKAMRGVIPVGDYLQVLAAEAVQRLLELLVRAVRRGPVVAVQLPLLAARQLLERAVAVAVVGLEIGVARQAVQAAVALEALHRRAAMAPQTQAAVAAVPPLQQMLRTKEVTAVPGLLLSAIQIPTAMQPQPQGHPRLQM